MTRLLRLVCTVCMLFGVSRAMAQSKETPLRVGDQIGIQISGVPPEDAAQINHNYRVSGKGTINLLYLSEVPAAGLAPSDLEQKISALYRSKEIYLNSTVSISIDITDPRIVFVSGAVHKPGPVSFRPGLTVSKAITSAGGSDEFARMSQVKLVRAGKVLKTLNLQKAGSPDGDIALEPEDEIVVTD